MIPRNFCAPKRVSTPKGVQMCSIWHFLFFQVELPSNNEYRANLKPNHWKLLHVWPIALSGTQNCPFPKGPFGAIIRNLGPDHLLDIITKEKPAKFQIKWTTASKVMRPHNVCAPKRVSTQKGAKIVPKFIFSVFQVEIPWNHVYSPNLKPNGWKLLNLWPTALFGTQNCPISIVPSFEGNCKFFPCHILDIITQNVPAKLQM